MGGTTGVEPISIILEIITVKNQFILNIKYKNQKWGALLESNQQVSFWRSQLLTGASALKTLINQT
ncbi:hypothetical protein TTHERM_000338558 (macronuclear) [Tetrahymena thermophila SB210]|uniref:Uncharacterized protein n=1 Tax=Tetrahymena thermophila (strain SB210) TaxID=312017 RepID=W7XC38_TETTS|nr:hypothetical protein TTHERM_000338558 [Tetrahymena thermophila SB210]EWS74038.1 hypothetical protein TTHERM_000338558 [Tetrahymena thermophila SB210]|eukprot:XP_012653437.1 hypothetical protein TTHERM_000338558 [Tetrahymena thermophila SB210]